MRRLHIAIRVLLAVALMAGAPAAAKSRHPHHSARPHHSRTVHAKPVEHAREAPRSTRADLRARLKGESNPTARKLNQWLYLTDESSGASFEELDEFLRSNPGWPRRTAMQTFAEKRMPRTLDNRAVLAWFDGKKAETGIGLVRLGEAEIAAGRAKAGADHIRQAWRNETFDRAAEQQILADHGDLLTKDVQDDRLAQLLYGSDETAVRRQMARVSQAALQMASLRQLLQKNPKKGLAQYAGSPLKDDPGVLFDAARAARQLGRTADTSRFLLRAARSDDVPPLRWWSEAVLSARDALKARAYQEAFDLASRRRLERGSELADAEFLAGWIALKYLGKPDLALKHFQILEQNVSRPISVARAHYWEGRSFDALKRKDEARAQYAIAAREPYTFYGQLALTRIEAHPVLRLDAQRPNSANSLAKDSRAEAFRYLAAIGAKDLAREFALSIARDDIDAAKATALVKLVNDSGDHVLALKVAKLAEYHDVIVPDALHPMDLPGFAGETPSLPRADVLALVRQESEFDKAATSGAGALGLMQLMPATAKQRAKSLGLPYSLSRLTSDAQYNIRLGATHFRAFFDAWRGSYVLAIASYNAGAGNVRKWVEMNGDPRNPSVDTVDWIEAIPFAETRNYVQRVIENMQVYRSRLGSPSLDIQKMLEQSGPVMVASQVTSPIAKPDIKIRHSRKSKTKRIRTVSAEIR